MKTLYKVILFILILLVSVSVLQLCGIVTIIPIASTTSTTTSTTIISSVCGNDILEEGERCDDGNLINWDGCSNKCKIEKEIEVYLAPYVGDIDGSVDPDWFFFFDQLRQWHDDNNIPVAISFYPRTIQSDTQFNRIIADMYLSKNIELLIKGEDDGEKRLEKMSYEEVKTLLESDQNHFMSKMQEILGTDDIEPLVSYNQLYARFTDTIRDAVHDLGFKIYFDLYVSELGYDDPLPDFDVIQYGVSFTVSGQAGPSETFEQSDQIIQEILDFDHDHMLYINGKRVVPTLCHQQDFLMGEDDNRVNQEKWNIYTTVLKTMMNDPRIQFLKPEEIYDLRHPS